MDTLDNNKLNNKKPGSNKSQNLIIVGMSFLSLLVGFTGGYLAKTLISNYSNPLVDKMSTCYNVLKEYWYYGNTEEEINKAVNELMLTNQSSADPYTFITASQEDQNLSLDSKGFGFQLVSVPNGFLIEKAFKSGALYASGAREGDIISSITVNGTSYSFINKSYAERQGYMNTAKTVGKASFTLLRGEEEIQLNDVSTSNFSQETAYKIDEFSDSSTLTIRIDSFLGENNNAPSKIVSDILKQNPNFQTLVLDVRDNGGGYLNEMADIASLFTPKDNYIYYAKNRTNNIVASAKQSDEPKYNNIDIKILQNGMTASASESLALSLKQNNDAEIYGFNSYGKGIAQTFYTFSDNSVLRFTYAKMFGPDGNTSIHDVGLSPDVNSSTYDIKEYPYNYSNYLLTSDNYNSNLDIVSSYLTYLGYEFSEKDSNSKLIETINDFQTDYGYEISTSYDETVTQELHYEIYKKVQIQNEYELSRVTNIAVN